MEHVKVICSLESELFLITIHSVFKRRSDKTIDFAKGATRARFMAQKLPLGNLFGPFDAPLNCFAKYGEHIDSNLYSFTE